MEDRRPVLMMTKIYRHFVKTQETRYERYNLTQQQLVFLLLILENDKRIGMNEITKILGINKSNTTRTIQALEKKNFIIKQDTGIKSQKFIISLTNEGRKIADQIKQDETKTMNKLLAGLSVDEQTLLSKIIDKLVSN